METITGKQLREAITTAPAQATEILIKLAHYLDDNNEATIKDFIHELDVVLHSDAQLQPLNTTHYNAVSLDVRNDGRIMIPSSMVKRLGLNKYSTVELDVKFIKGELND